MADNTNSSNLACGLNRREFLGSCAACAAGLMSVSALGAKPAAVKTSAGGEKAKVRLIFTHIQSQTPTWPNIGYDYEARKKELTQKLRKGCPGIEFLPATAQNGNEAKKILEADKEVDGYLVYMIGIWTGASQIIAAKGRPTIFVDDLYGGSGEFLGAYSIAKRQGLKVTGVSSSNFNDVIQAVRCFECIKKLGSSKILCVRKSGVGGRFAESIEKVCATKVLQLTFEQLDEAYRNADPAEAQKWADRWIREAKKVVEPSRQEIEKSAAMYVGMCDLLKHHQAQAITVDCLGGFYGGKITAYPCLGFFQLNNDGYVGACEADLKSTITMLLMGYLVGRPGYISDPVIDTSKNQIIYAHCVAPNKVFGPDGPANPYHIRSHSEDRKGAAVRSLMPLGQMTTTLEFDPHKRQVLIHQGKSVANIDEDKACRTKLAVEVKGDIDKLFNYWDQWGWHRVTFYGDLKRPVQHIATLLGFEVVEEAYKDYIRRNVAQDLGMVIQWMLIGPFDNTNNQGHNRVYPPEKRIDFSQTYTGKNGERLKWQEHRNPEYLEKIDFLPIFKQVGQVCAYAAVTVESSKKRKVQIRLGSNDSVKMWLNGKEIWNWDNPSGRGVIFDDDVVPVTLPAGKSQILLKISNLGDNWGFCFRITDEHENRIPDLKYSLQ